jgi:hypothetical protein
MRSIQQIKAFILREFWYERGEALVNQLCLLDRLIEKAWEPSIKSHLEERRYKIGEKLENADRNFWYYSARDGRP